MAEEKTVTEVIQEIKNEVDEILAYVRNMDLKYTLILDRLNKLTSSATPPIVAPVAPKLPTVDAAEITFPEYQPPAKPTTSQSTNLKSKLQLALEQAEKDEQDSEQLSVETHQDGKRRNLRQHAETQTRQIPAQQRIAYSDGKPVFMASVEILDANQNTVKQTKTNQVGKWLAPLMPGEYTVKVSKGSSALKPKVELSYRVTIPNQDSAVDLGTKTVES